jgi:hypothetical protein
MLALRARSLNHQQHRRGLERAAEIKYAMIVPNRMNWSLQNTSQMNWFDFRSHDKGIRRDPASSNAV